MVARCDSVILGRAWSQGLVAYGVALVLLGWAGSGVGVARFQGLVMRGKTQLGSTSFG